MSVRERAEPTFFSIKSRDGKFDLFFSNCGYCVNDEPTYRAAYRKAQQHVRHMHQQDRVRPQIARGLRTVVTYL